MVKSEAILRLPTGKELPCSDDTPVDNELQNLIPNLLEIILASIWHNRRDWFFAVDMGVYHQTGTKVRSPIVPDGFLSLGVERVKDGEARDSYVVWEEKNVVPIWVLEIVSKTYGGEYDRKMADYARLGVSYYTIYNPKYWQKQKRKSALEVYHLEEGSYRLLEGEPIWLPEVGLGIGCSQGKYCGLEREWLFWFDEAGNRFSLPEELLENAVQRARIIEEQLAAERLKNQQKQQAAIANLQALGLSLEQITEALGLDR
ncbi:MAG: Uma2 family endonuclease [Spirulinaceae cyanobacterium]